MSCFYVNPVRTYIHTVEVLETQLPDLLSCPWESGWPSRLLHFLDWHRINYAIGLNLVASQGEVGVAAYQNRPGYVVFKIVWRPPHVH